MLIPLTFACLACNSKDYAAACNTRCAGDEAKIGKKKSPEGVERGS